MEPNSVLIPLLRNLSGVMLCVFDEGLVCVLAEGDDSGDWGHVGQRVADDRLETLLRGALAGSPAALEVTHGTRTYRVQVVPLPGDDGVIRSVGLIAQDISAEKQREAQCFQQQQQLRFLFDHNKDSVLLVDFDGLILEANPRAAALLGFTTETIRGVSVLDISNPTAVEMHGEHLHQLKMGQSIEVFEEWLMSKDDRYFLAEVSAATIFDEQQQPLYIQCFVRDVTDQYQVSEALRQSEERYRIISELMFDFAYAYKMDEDGQAELEWVTEDSFRRLTGYGSQEILQQGTFALFHPSEHERLAAGRRQLRLGQTMNEEYRIVTKTGEERWVYLSRRPVWDEQQQRVVRFYGVAQDITERKQAELALRASEQRYRVISELISDYAYSFLVDEGGELRLDWVTEGAFQRITGYVPGDLVYKDDFALYHPDDRDFVRQCFEAVRAGKRTGGDYRIITREGRIRWINIELFPVWDDARRNVIQYYGVAHDITDRKEIEMALRRSEELLNETQEVARIGGWEYDLVNKRLMWTRYTKIIHEVPQDFEPDLDTAFGFYAPEYIPVITQAFSRALEGVPFDLELKFITATGRLIWVRSIGRTEVVDGKVQRVYGSFQDITERKEAEIALRQSEERYRNLSELISDYAFAIRVLPDQSERVEWLTVDSFTRMTGYPLEEVEMLSSGSHLFHPDDRAAVQADIKRVKAGESVRSERRIVTKDGAVRWVQISRRPVWDVAQQRVVRFYGVAQDITERKEAEIALRQSEERYRNLSELISDYAFAIRMQEDGTETLEWLTSESFTRITGYTAEEITSLQSSAGLFHPDERDDIHDEVRRVKRGESLHSERRIITKAGETRWIQISRRPIWNTEGKKVAGYYGVARDITDRRLQQEALALSEARLAHAASIAKLGYWELDVSTEVFTFNDQFYAIFRTTAEAEGGYQMHGARYKERFVPPDEQIVVEAITQHAYGTAAPYFTYTGEHRIVRADGTLGWITVQYTVQKDEKGEVILWHGANQDITERKEAEIALRQSEERYRILTELISDYAFAAHVEGDKLVLDWLTDESYLKITGYTRDEIAGMSIIHPDDRERVTAERQSVIRGELTESVYRIITKSGLERWIHLNRYPVWDEAHEKITMIYGVAQDITDRKLMEDALRESEERFRVIAQATLDGLYDIHLLTAYTWYSDSYRLLLGIPSHIHDITAWWTRHVHPDDYQRHHANHAAIMAGRLTQWQEEYRLLKDNGREVVVMDRGYVILDEAGRSERIIGALTDVTHLRDAEKRKLELELTRERMRFFADFVTAISHDFRTPLSIIMTSAYLMERAETPEQRKDQVDKVKAQVGYIEGLVEGMLMITQIDNREAFTYEPVDLNSLLEYSRVREEEASRAKSLTITYDLDPDLPPVLGDNQWLYQCIINLIENARHYTPEYGSVHISTLLQDGEVLVRVADTGIGIEAAALGRIFEPLYRVAAHRPTNGQGLGLAIALKIARSHGGTIDVESEVGVGSVFTLRLPVKVAVAG